MSLHADLKGAQAAKGQEGVEGRVCGAGRVLVEPELINAGLVPHHDGPANHVAVAADVLGGGVNHVVHPELDRALESRRGKGIVHRHLGTDLTGARDGLLKRGDRKQWIGGSLHIEQTRVARKVRQDRGVARVHVLDPDSEALLDSVEKSVSATIEVIAGNDQVAGLERKQQGVDGGHPGSEGEGGSPALEVGQRVLQGKTGRVLGAGVLVAASWLAGAVLDEGAGQVDRGHDCAGLGVGLPAGVDGASPEAGVRVALGRDVLVGVRHRLRLRGPAAAAPLTYRDARATPSHPVPAPAPARVR